MIPFLSTASGPGRPALAAVNPGIKILSVHERPMGDYYHRFDVEAAATPEYALPVEARVVAKVSVADAARAFRPRDAVDRAIIQALPDDFWPPWAPI